MTFYLIAVAIILPDQATKWVIVGTLRLGQGLPVVPGFFDLVFVLNPGAAFSFLATLPDSVRNPFFITISVTAVILILVYRTRHLQQHELASLSLALVLGFCLGWTTAGLCQPQVSLPAASAPLELPEKARLMHTLAE